MSDKKKDEIDPKTIGGSTGPVFEGQVEVNDKAEEVTGGSEIEGQVQTEEDIANEKKKNNGGGGGNG